MARNYKKRISRDKDAYQIYLRWRSELKEKGYHLQELKSREDFNKDYNLYRSDPAIKNKIRKIAREDIVATKTWEKKQIKEMFRPGGDKTFADYYNWETGHLDFQGKSRKEIFDEIMSSSDETLEKISDTTKRGWHYLWEEQFYRGRGLY